jgi:hypothetical protein
VARFAGTCALWAPPATQRFAYGVGPNSADGFTPFRIADLGQPHREFDGYRALFGVVVWSADGQRVAWCGRRRTGFDLEVGGPARRLPQCPVAYTPDDRIAYAVENRLIVDGRTVVQAKGGITFVHYGTDGSVAVVVDGVRLERWFGGVRDAVRTLPTELQGKTPILSPDNCAAVFAPLQDYGTLDFRELGCYQGRRPHPFAGTDAAWSPDGRWLAVAERDTIAFDRVVGAERTIRWPAAAAQLAWHER